ncbi:nucleotide-diphospho-sugar transferase [Tricladium varicosporioides]|nr:nucleotide-diphospho-sugar transferase [Hymenoscyphus varicosporioides]
MRQSSRVIPRPTWPYRIVQITIFIGILLCMRYTSFATESIKLHHMRGLSLAYATLLLPSDDNTTLPDPNADVYFRSIRLLNYQLKYDQKTRTQNNIPLVVLVTPDVAPWKIQQLKKEGAKIITVQKLDSSWIDPLADRWRNVLVKLRLFELEKYDRILFLDADTFLLKPIDGIFADPGASLHRTLSQAELKSDEGKMPETYLFASNSEVQHTTHIYPPIPISYFNAGFFLLRPSTQLFNYYISLFGLKGDRFDTRYPEQNLFNYAHRQSGNMPWSRLSHIWNIVLPNMRDVKMGVKSVHAKCWGEGNELQPLPEGLRKMWWSKKEEMERFYLKREPKKEG